MALLLLGCKFSGWLLSLSIDPLRHLEPQYWHMGRRWAGKSGNLPTLNYDIHRWCHNRGMGLWDSHAVCPGIESICLSCVQKDHPSNAHTHQEKAPRPKRRLMAPSVLVWDFHVPLNTQSITSDRRSLCCPFSLQTDGSLDPVISRTQLTFIMPFSIQYVKKIQHILPSQPLSSKIR